MKLRITNLTKAVITRTMPNVLGAAITYHHEQGNVLTACHVQVDGVFLSFWSGEHALASRPLYVGSMIDRPNVSSFGQREAAAYSALAHVIGVQLVVVDTPLFHALLKLTQRVASHVTEVDSAEEEVAGYWRTYEKECGLAHNARIELDDADDSAVTDSTLALNTLRDMFYEYMAFDFTSPSESGYWARVWGYDEWQKLKEVDAAWEFVKLDNDDIVPSAFIAKVVSNRPRRPHCVISSDIAFDVIPEIEDDELRLWMAEPRVFNNVPDNIVADCERNTFNDSDIQLSVVYKDGGPDSNTSRVTYTFEEHIF